MNWGETIAKLMILFNVLAGVLYFIQGDVRRGIYWVAAAVLTGAVTF